MIEPSSYIRTIKLAPILAKHQPPQNIRARQDRSNHSCSEESELYSNVFCKENQNYTTTTEQSFYVQLKSRSCKPGHHHTHNSRKAASNKHNEPSHLVERVKETSPGINVSEVMQGRSIGTLIVQQPTGAHVKHTRIIVKSVVKTSNTQASEPNSGTSINSEPIRNLMSSKNLVEAHSNPSSPQQKPRSCIEVVSRKGSSTKGAATQYNGTLSTLTQASTSSTTSNINCQSILKIK